MVTALIVPVLSSSWRLVEAGLGISLSWLHPSFCHGALIILFEVLMAANERLVIVKLPPK